MGGPDKLGIEWWGDLLNVDSPKVSRSHSFILSMFSAVHGNGSSVISGTY